MFKAFWSTLIYRPIVNILLLLLLAFNGNLGIAIVILTLFIRAILWNTTKQQTQLQTQGMGGMQDKLKELEEKYKDQPDVLAKESMKVMKTDGMGPLKGCLTLLIQLPIFFGLNYAINEFSTGKINSANMYSFLKPLVSQFLNIQNINPHFLGMNLFDKHNIALTIIGALLIFVQTKITTLMQTKNKPAQPMVGPGGQAMPDMQKMMGPMNIFMVIMMGSFIYGTASGLGLYIVVSTLVAVVQYAIQNREIIKISWLTRSVDVNKVLPHK